MDYDMINANYQYLSPEQHRKLVLAPNRLSPNRITLLAEV